MDVAGIEYFFDEDPGIGKGTPVGITSPGSNLIADFVIDLDGLNDGDHIVYIRTKDQLGWWGPAYAHAFSMTGKIIDNKEVVSWFRMYPNPEQGTVSIDFSDNQPGRSTLMINDLNGQTVYSNTLCDKYTTLSVRLPAGVYRLTIEAGNKVFMQKLVISQ
jgi:hypothetical protein